MLAIKNNIMAGNAARHLGKAYDSLATSVERLASGLRINSARDDAAGLAVRELIRADIAVLQQGSRNASDGISMLQTMEGAMGVIDDALIRMKELAEQAATGSYSAAQRTIMNSEFAEMAAEIERIAGATAFNGIEMLNTGTGDVSIHVGTTSTIDIDKVDMTQAGLSIETGNGEWAIETLDAGYALTATALDISGATGDGYRLDITFQGEEVIDAIFAITGGASSDGVYTLQEVADVINVASQNPAQGYDASGNSLSYAAASLTETNTGTYKLKLAARGTSATTLAIAIAADSDATAGDPSGVFGTITTLSASIMDDDLFEASNTSGVYATNSVGGAGSGLNILTEAAAITALATVTTAINTKDSARATFGYKMNRLESTIAILDIQAENLMSAESRVSDVDVATEMATLTRTQVLSQAGIAMLAQANAMPQMALTLLR